MGRKRTMIVASVILLAASTACSGDAKPHVTTSSPVSRPPASTGPPVTGSPDHPVGVVGIGHSGMTGYQSDPSSPETDVEDNSWATGTNPTVHSIYQRLVKARPETASNVVNAAHNGATAERLLDQVSAGLRRVPYPALVIVQIGGNDIRCDGTDPRHYAEFGALVREAVQLVVKTSPKTAVVLVTDPGRPAGWAATVASLPTTPKSFIGMQPCYPFSANRTVNRTAVAHVTELLTAYEAQLAKSCQGITQCHTDGGAAARMQDRLDDLGADLQHPSIKGHAHIAATEWPVIASVLGLS